MTDQEVKTSIATKVELDEVPFNKFHFKIAALTFGAHWNDGFAIGIIGIALTLITPAMDLNSFWKGAIGSGVLLGLFAGSLFFGWLSDKVGRQKIFTASFVVITIATLLQFWAEGPLMIWVLRILIGIGLGGDYAVGHTLLAEILPRKGRGEILGSFSVIWTIGYVFASFAGIWILQSGMSDDSKWRWMLILPGFVALAILILRLGTPESPRWLMRQGRGEEAMAIVHKYFGPDVVLESEDSNEKPGTFKELFGPEYLTKTIFNMVFWAAMVMPYFAIYTFLPDIVEAMGLSGIAEGDNGSVWIDVYLSCFLIVGALLGIYLTYKLSRRGFLISHFFILATLLFVLALVPTSMTVIMVGAFALFTMMLSAVSNLVGVFPAESYPTRLRSTGVGLATSASRLGSAVSTWVLPVSLAGIGLSWTMGWLGAVLVIGGLVSLAWAPETKGKQLAAASRADKDGAVH